MSDKAKENKKIEGCKKIWNENLEKVKTFIDENDKKPSRHSKDEEEKKLASWITSQNGAYKSDKQLMKYDDIKEAYAEFLEDYSEYFSDGDHKAEWYKQLNLVKEFVKEYDKFPSRRNGDTFEEKRLAIWLLNQQKNYKNNNKLLKDRQICDDYKKFIDLIK